MIIEKPEEISRNILNLLEKNPLRDLLVQEEKILDSSTSIASSYSYDIDQYNMRIVELKLKKGVAHQKARRSEENISKLKCKLSKVDLNQDLSFLERNQMETFFNNLGLEFIKYQISKYEADNAYIHFVRPTRMISILPTPPMQITLYYGKVNGDLVLKKISADISIGTDNDYLHPHISDSGNICMGNFFDVMNENGISYGLDGYQDHVLLLENLLNTFNSDSPYSRIDKIITNLANNIYFKANNFFYIENSDYFVMPSDAYKGYNRILETELITRKRLEDYFTALKEIKVCEVAQDIIDSLPLLYNSDDSDRENYEYLGNFRESINKLLNVKLTRESNFSYETDDCIDDDYELGIEYDGFEDLCAKWVEEIHPLTLTQDILQFNNLPNLDVIFPPITIIKEFPDVSF